MLYFRWKDILKPENHKKIHRAGTARINACGDSRLRGWWSRKPIGFIQWVVHDYGYDGKGVVHVCHCANCGADIEYRVRTDNQEDYY